MDAVHRPSGDPDDLQPWLQIERDASGCVTEVRARGIEPTRLSCGLDGSPLHREEQTGALRWSPPTAQGAGWTQVGGSSHLGPPRPVRQTWTPIGDHGAQITFEGSGHPGWDLRLELGAPGPTGPRPPWDHLPWNHLPAWSSGVTRVVTDAQGRLVAQEGQRYDERADWQVRWSPDGRSGELAFNDRRPVALRCGPGRCEVPAMGWTEVWSCPAI